YSYDASLNAGGTAGGGNPPSGTVGTGPAYGEKPTITYTPPVGEEFAPRMLTPPTLDAIMLFQQGGWNADRLPLVTVQRMNDVFNAPTAGGPTPARPPDYEAFADLAERLERLRSARLAGFNWEQKENETQPPGRNPRFWIRPPADPRSPLAADVVAVRSRRAMPVLAQCALSSFAIGAATHAGHRGGRRHGHGRQGRTT